MVVAHMAACNLLAVVLDASGAYAESLSAEQPSQRVKLFYRLLIVKCDLVPTTCSYPSVNAWIT